jgi:hypothetical protein
VAQGKGRELIPGDQGIGYTACRNARRSEQEAVESGHVHEQDTKNMLMCVSVWIEDIHCTVSNSSCYATCRNRYFRKPLTRVVITLVDWADCKTKSHVSRIPCHRKQLKHDINLVSQCAHYSSNQQKKQKQEQEHS